MNIFSNEFWLALDQLIKESQIVIDRPKGSTHPNIPSIVYKFHNDSQYMKGVLIRR